MWLTTLQIFSILLIFVGESLFIYSEVAGARKVEAQSKVSSEIFVKFFFLVIISGALSLAGYFVGIIAFKNIWIVSVISIVSILIIEPILDYSIFKQFPAAGALIGFVLGSIGLVATLLIR